jgi:hypothetical protein
MFDPNIAGETATFTLPSIPGTQYSIQVTGQNNQSSSLFQFLVDPDGLGPSGFIQLGNNVNFGNGFNTITLATFTDLGTSDFFRIIKTAALATAGGRFLASRSPQYRFQPLSRFWPLGLACWVCSAGAGSGRLRQRLEPFAWGGMTLLGLRRSERPATFFGEVGKHEAVRHLTGSCSTLRPVD